MSLSAAIIYVVVLVAASFVVSGVVQRYHDVKRRRARVEEFERQYRAWTDAREHDYEGVTSYGGPPSESEESSKLRAWLVPRRKEMQRDAQRVGKGIAYVAPPPAIGGGPCMPHSYFADLFDEQSFTDYAPRFRLDELATIVHETGSQESLWQRDLYNLGHGCG